MKKKIALIRIDSSSVADNTDLSVRESKRILSSASDAFEMSSRKKISLFLEQLEFTSHLMTCNTQ